MTTQKRNLKNVAASILAGIAIVVVLGLASWGLSSVFDTSSTSSTDSSSASTEVSETATTQDGEQTSTHQVTDCVGRTVEVPDNPQNVACMDSFAGTVCVLCGGGDQLMGAPGGVLSNVMLSEIYPDLSNLTTLSGNTVNVETMLSQNVDVIFVKRSVYEGDQLDTLESLGIPYVVMDYETVDQQISAIQIVGDVLGGDAKDKAYAVADEYSSTVDLVEERTSSLDDSEKPKVYHSINDPLLTDGSDSLGADWIERCGAVDVSAGESGTNESGDYTATLEQIYNWDPDYIICNTAEAKNEILSDSKWAALDAVKEGHVYNLPVSTSRWGQRGDPETFLGMLWLAETIHPDLFSDIDLETYAKSYYSNVIGIEIDDELWEQILSGEGLRTQGSGSGDGSGSGGN
ncbi:MAG: ABC transporter substrate-binding protein [Coriobacteriales bacterium]|jgi:iron complex transport system substrate-binding protein